MKQFLFTGLFRTLLIFSAIQTISCKGNISQEKQAESTDDQAIISEITKMEKARLTAGLTKDLAVFDSATAADYLQIDIDGNVLNKPAMLERVKSSYAKLRSNEPTDMIIRVYGNTAILTAQGNPRGIMKDIEFTDSIRYSRIYVKRDGRWQVVLFQQTRINPGK